MKKWSSRILLSFGLVAMLAIAAKPVRGQAGDKEKPVIYTYVAEWAVPRPGGRWTRRPSRWPWWRRCATRTPTTTPC